MSHFEDQEPQEDFDVQERICAACGAPEGEWAGYDSLGFAAANGEIYCCQACAEKRVCSCNPERLEALVKKRSA